MAGVPAGSQTFFRVSPAAQSFAVRRGNTTERFDPHAHTPRFHDLLQTLEKVGSKPLGSLVKYSEEVWDKADGRFNDVFPYIEISGVGLGTNEYEVTETPVSEAPSRARQTVQAGDILVSLTRPHRGAIAEVKVENDGAIASTGFAVVRDVDSEQVDRDYVRLCLTSSFGCDQMLMRSSGGNYPAITKDELSRVLIPCVSLEAQQRLVAAMVAARAQRKAQLAEADELLAGIDGFLLEALGLTPQQEDTRRVFAVKGGDVNSGTLGPALYVPELQNYLNRLRNNPAGVKPLSMYVEINPSIDLSNLSDDALVGFIPMEAVSDGATGEYKVERRPLKGVRKGYTPFRNGDVLWAKMLSCMQNGKSCVVDELPNGVGFGSTEFHVLRVRSTGTSKEFVKEYISQATLRRVAAYAATGSVQQRVPAEFLENLPFPEIPESRQNEIVASINRRRQQARRLRSAADAGWRAAKQRFEAALLGE